MEAIQILDYAETLGPYFVAVISAAGALAVAKAKSKPFIESAVKSAQSADAESQGKFRDDLMARIRSVNEQNERLEKRLSQCVDDCHTCKEEHAQAKIELLEETVQRKALEARVSEMEIIIRKSKE